MTRLFAMVINFDEQSGRRGEVEICGYCWPKNKPTTDNLPILF